MPIALTVSGPVNAGIFGLHLDLTLRGDGARIHSVTHAPEFSAVSGEVEGELPGDRFRMVRTQPPGSPDLSLGANGVPVPFATIMVEALSSHAFTAELEIKVRGALIGETAEVTRIDGVPPEPGQDMARAVIQIVNTNPPAPEEMPAPELPVMQMEAADLALHLQPVGGGDPVTALQPNTSYEVHYATRAAGVSGYSLFGVSPTAAQSFSTAVAAPDGSWSSTGCFATRELANPDGSPVEAYGCNAGLFRHVVVEDRVSYDPSAPPAPHQGHLCNITTGSAGVLNLHAYMWWMDMQNFRCTNMETQASFVVGSP